MFATLSQVFYMRFMRFWLFFLILCGLVLCPFSRVSIAEAQGGDTIHVVRVGETLTAISRRYGVSIQALANYNGIRNINHIRVGQRLRIPSSNQPSRIATPPVRIATATSAPNVNRPATRPLVVIVTPKPVVPVVRASPLRRGEVAYTVYAGDSLYGIAARYNTSAGAIIARNNLPSTTIYVGQRLIIPASVQPQASLPTQAAVTAPTPTPVQSYETTLPMISKDIATPASEPERQPEPEVVVESETEPEAEN
jgi:LysM repeat protein